MTIHQYRTIVKGRCIVCGDPFTGIKTKKTCSNRCRQTLKRETNKNLIDKPVYR